MYRSMLKPSCKMRSACRKQKRKIVGDETYGSNSDTDNNDLCRSKEKLNGGGIMEELKIDTSVGKLRITGECIDDIMATALDGGITYWCNKAEVIGEYLGEYASDQISRGGKLKLYDYEAETTYELTIENLIAGIKALIDDDSIEVNLTKRENCFELDEDYLDSTLSDLIIQYAVFGELVYA